MEHVKNIEPLKEPVFAVNFPETKDCTPAVISPIMCKMKDEVDKNMDLYAHPTDVDDEKLYMTFQLNNISSYEQCYSQPNSQLNENIPTKIIKNEQQEGPGTFHEHSHEITNLSSDSIDAEKPFKCTDCDYKTKRANCLINHTRVHSGVRPYGCPFCSYRASLKDHLTRHIRTHTGAKPYKCPHCTYTSAHSSALKRHIRHHTGDRPYSCPHCSYRSIQRSAITKHITRHTGDRPFSCPHCDYKAAHNETLKRHLKIHGQDPVRHREHNCPYCRYTTTQAKAFQCHIMKHKNEDPQFKDDIKELWK